VIILTTIGVIPVAHCLLNPHAKVRGSLDNQQIRQAIIVPLIQHGFGIFQLPCPELSHSGLQRWGQSRSQYAHPFFLQHCRQIAATVVSQFEEYQRCDIPLGPILGVEGSPSCGVSFTYDGNWGGEPLHPMMQMILAKPLGRSPRPGVFMEILQEELKKRNINIPFIGIDEEKLEESREHVFCYLDLP